MALLPVHEALERILSGAKRLGSEKCALSQTLGRVTATPLVAKRDQPPFRASAMDGYAVRCEDLAQLPASLKVVGASAAGKEYGRPLRSGQAVRIFTGAPVPAGADAVVIQESVTRAGEVATIQVGVREGQNTRNRGSDFQRGQSLVPAGVCLTPRDIGLAATMNCAVLNVVRRPTVAILATGNELVLPGSRPNRSQIVSSNSNALEATGVAMGAAVINGGIVRDDLRATIRAVNKLSTADILVTSGGASVGDHDYVQEALRAAGVEIDFWKIAMRPGKPFMYGRKGRLHVLGLPGNPVSALVCAELFLKPLIRKLLGLEPVKLPEMLEVGADLGANDERQDHLRARLVSGPQGRLLAIPFDKQDSSMMRTFREADCLIVRPPHAVAAPAGSLVPILRL